MRFLITTLLVLSTISDCSAVEAYGYAMLNSPHANKCFVRGSWLMDPDTSMQHPFACAVIHCFQNTMATIQTCTFYDPSNDTPFWCEDKGELNTKADFPECCDHTIMYEGKVADIFD